ncbi:hypothetical protein D9M71_715350 [compost metagenome]
MTFVRIADTRERLITKPLFELEKRHCTTVSQLEEAVNVIGGCVGHHIELGYQRGRQRQPQEVLVEAAGLFHIANPHGAMRKLLNAGL